MERVDVGSGMNLSGPRVKDRLFSEYMGKHNPREQALFVKELIAERVGEVCALHEAMVPCRDCEAADVEPPRLCISCLQPIEGDEERHPGCLEAGQAVKREINGTTYYMGMEGGKIVGVAELGKKKVFEKFEYGDAWQNLFDHNVKPTLDRLLNVS